MTSANGHTVQLAVQGQPGPVPAKEIRLECTCGKVFARGLFPVDDPEKHVQIQREGWRSAQEHLREQKASGNQKDPKDLQTSQ